MDDHPATYDSRPRRSPTQWLESQPLYDWLLAAYQNTRYSVSPMDYHHVHYPDDGTTLEKAHLGWRLWTVNWHALQNQSDILFRNERQINILETRNFGRLAFVEVGAMSVGRIVQVHPLDQHFERSAAKSVFKFGGSAVVVFGETGAWSPSDDILQQTKQGVETLVRLGDCIASQADI
jgi:phosphatidylserine decarboxylase